VCEWIDSVLLSVLPARLLLLLFALSIFLELALARAIEAFVCATCTLPPEEGGGGGGDSAVEVEVEGDLCEDNVVAAWG